MTSQEKVTVINSYKDLINRIKIINSYFESESRIITLKDAQLLADLVEELELKFKQANRNMFVALLQDTLKS